MLALLLLWALQAPAAAPSTPPADEATQAVPYPGPLDEGLAELARASDDEEHERALELAAGLRASPRVSQLSEPRRARLLHDTGLARARGGRVDQAVADLRAAAALGGPGVLRATSLFEAGTVRLQRAEELRQDVPEIAQRLGLPTPPVAPIAPGASDAPDPLAMAREAYLGARAELLERLRLDWRDEDTRANLELAARRLRELDEVERQREEQQDQQQQQQQDPQQQQDQQQQDQGQQDEGQDQPPQQEQPPPEGSEGEEQPGDEQPEPSPPEPEPGEEQQQAQPEQAREEERVLSREEVQRLLDQLQEIEEQARAVRALLRERRRSPVEKDW